MKASQVIPPTAGQARAQSSPLRDDHSRIRARSDGMGAKVPGPGEQRPYRSRYILPKPLVKYWEACVSRTSMSSPLRRAITR